MLSVEVVEGDEADLSPRGLLEGVEEPTVWYVY